MDTYYATEEEISANKARNRSLRAQNLNTIGRADSDVGKRMNGVSLHNNIKLVINMECESLKKHWEINTVPKEMERYNVSILGLVKVHWTSRGSILTADTCRLRMHVYNVIVI